MTEPRKKGFGVMIAIGKPKEAPPALRPPEEIDEPEEREAEPVTGLDAIGEQFGLSPSETQQFARRVMEHFMGQCGGGEREGGEQQEMM